MHEGGGLQTRDEREHPAVPPAAATKRCGDQGLGDLGT